MVNLTQLDKEKDLYTGNIIILAVDLGGGGLLFDMA